LSVWKVRFCYDDNGGAVGGLDATVSGRGGCGVGAVGVLDATVSV